MKAFLRKLVRHTVGNRYGWAMIRPFVWIADYFSYHHADQQPISEKEYRVNPLYISIFGEPVVRNGPFKGLRYPGFKSYGSTLYPKLIGSYEAELTSIVEQVCIGDYATVLDIGSAEGFYAVGIAYRNRHTVVHAFDTNPRANAFCVEMARLNGVAERVKIGSFCSSNTLASMDLSKKSFILCDCEGYEKYLFDKTNVGNLMNCDILIETHDFIDMTISTGLVDLFKDTHKLTVIRSLDDIDKVRHYQYPELTGQDLNIRKELLSEGRPGLMEWLYFQSTLS